MSPAGPAFDPGFALGGGSPPRPLDPARRYDALVLGAGPAGLAAAVYLLRKGFATGILAGTLGGQVAWTASVENYLGYRLVDGAELVRRFREQVEELGPDVTLGLEATGVEPRGEGFAVRAGGASYAARVLVIATGKRPRALGVPGGERLLGRGVAFCAACDAPLYRGRVVGVAGGGNSGLETALDLARISPRVHLFQDQDRLSGDAVLERRVRELPQVEVHLGTRVVEVLGEGRVTAVRVEAAGGGAALEVALEGLFVEVGLVPGSAPFRDLLRLNARGEIAIDAACRTSVPGIFAAGDVTDVPYKQIIVAAGEGAKAALAAHEHLLRQGA
jgi:alkyl hydroperoxide reductase subunit F